MRSPDLSHVPAALTRHSEFFPWGFGMARPNLASIGRIALLAALAIAIAVTVPAAVPTSPDAIPGAARRIVADLSSWAHSGYQRRPAVMIGLAGFLALPVIAMIGLLFNLVASRHPPARRGLPQPLHEPPRVAWLEVPDNGASAVEIRREFIQIGREKDNDICLADDTVHRYHAVIERSHDQGFVITDVSGPNGNGVRVNGARTARAQLANGDMVELGKARLRFAAAA